MCQVVSDDQRITHGRTASTKTEIANTTAEDDIASTSDRCSVQCGLNRRVKSDGDIASDQRVTSAQLAQHNTEDDCWMAIKGKVKASSAK